MSSALKESAPPGASQTGQNFTSQSKNATAGAIPQEREIPHSLMMEKSVLSSLMKYPERRASLDLEVGAFHFPAHRTIYAEIITFPEGEVDLVSLVDRLNSSGNLDAVGGLSGVTELYTFAPNDSRFAEHLAIVEDCHRRRMAIAACRNAIEAAFDRTSEGAYLTALSAPISEVIEAASSGGKSKGFPLVLADELGSTTEPADFVEGLLTEGGASVVYGPSNVGKSFWILDLAVHVATGKPWRDGEVEVDQGAVVYVALEGAHGLKNRVEAMKREGILTEGAPFFICTSPVSLLDPTHGTKLAETVKAAALQSSLPCRLVIIDTLARGMAGGNENAGEDMGTAVKSIDAVRAATGAHVCVIHHCGKNEAMGARGHSSLRAAVDTEIEVSRPEGEHVSTVRATKQRDLDRCEPMPFSLKVVNLKTGRRGNQITSCVVHHEDEMMASKPKTAGRKPSYSADAMLNYLPADNATDWFTKASEDCGVKRTTFPCGDDHPHPASALAVVTVFCARIDSEGCFSGIRCPHPLAG